MTAYRRVNPAASRCCRECGTIFTGESWQRLCWPCWRAEKDEQEREDVYDRGYAAGYAAACASPRPGVLDRDLIARAIALTHPDRHPLERAADANAVTAALLALRELAA